MVLEDLDYILSRFALQFDITKEPVVVVVVSTTGDGEPPETVSKYIHTYLMTLVLSTVPHI